MHYDLNAFLTSKAAAGLAPDTLRWYRMFIGKYLDWSHAQKMSNKKPETVEAFLTYLRIEGKSAFTISGCFRALRVYFNWMVQRKRLRHNPMIDVQPPQTPRKRKRRVTDEQLRQLYFSIDGDGWIDARDRAIFIVLFYSGLRASEVCALRVEDVDRVQMVLSVNSGKGDKDRDVPFIPQLLEHLDIYLSQRPSSKQGWLFLAQLGHHAKRGHLTYEGLKEIMRRRCEAAGLPRLGLHSFRHGYAMQFLNAGMELGAVSQSLGHSSTEITRRFYVEWETAEMCRKYNVALRRLSPKFE